ncbi:VOC family protein [Ruegeria sp. WL0004]|uniref:VOC family protein n=1 Tax=Ruegeria marisflavi TaxID=2984152 RepID=A0ABT2WV93_9RHOB|nr:VOC family protein [Ruegeria sp. WL0004]MCU9839814.1 VOC family protein [Ruegeria sp. WL0004]
MSYLPEHFLIWGELPVTDMNRSVAFYSKVTGAELTIDTSGPNPMAVFKPAAAETGVALHLYPGTPAGDGSGPTLHLAAEGALEETMSRVTQAGGEVISPAITIPAGRFFYAKDPDGNSVGFFETTTA